MNVILFRIFAGLGVIIGGVFAMLGLSYLVESLSTALAVNPIAIALLFIGIVLLIVVAYWIGFAIEKVVQ